MPRRARWIALLELSARHERDGAGDAPWPPHYASRRASRPGRSRQTRADRSAPLIEVARAEREADAIAAAEQWKEKHPKAAAHLEPADVLVDRMRGSSSQWYRVRINLTNVPVRLRPKQETPDQAASPRRSTGLSSRTRSGIHVAMKRCWPECHGLRVKPAMTSPCSVIPDPGSGPGQA